MVQSLPPQQRTLFALLALSYFFDDLARGCSSVAGHLPLLADIVLCPFLRPTFYSKLWDRAAASILAQQGTGVLTSVLRSFDKFELIDWQYTAHPSVLPFHAR